jgi:hypothetical protein
VGARVTSPPVIPGRIMPVARSVHIYYSTAQNWQAAAATPR